MRTILFQTVGSIGLIFDELQALQNSSGEHFPKDLKKMQLVAEKVVFDITRLIQR